MSTQGPLKAGLCAYHGRGGAGTRAFKPQIAERTRQRKWAALRKFVCKSEDALKRKKKQALARSSRVWEKLCHFFHCWLQKRKKETTLRLFTRRRPERIKQVFFFRFFAFREDWERCGCVICLNDTEAGFWGACNIHMQEHTQGEDEGANMKLNEPDEILLQ